MLNLSKHVSNLRAQASKIGQFTSLQDSLHKYEKLHVVHPFYETSTRLLNSKNSKNRDKLNPLFLSNADRFRDTMLLLKNIENLKIVKNTAIPVDDQNSINQLFYSDKQTNKNLHVKNFYQEINLESYDAEAIFFNIPELKPGIIAKIQSNLVKSDKQILILDRRRVILSIFYRNLGSSGSSYFETKIAELRMSVKESIEFDKLISKKTGGFKRDGGGMKGGSGGSQVVSGDNRDLHSSGINQELRNLELKYQKYQQKKRKKSNFVDFKTENIDYQKSVAVVGYTNAGKSSLIELVTKKLDRFNKIVENKYFATLDTRKYPVLLPESSIKINFFDTVGFIGEVPQELFDAFLSTYKAARLADFVVHVVDASDPLYLYHAGVTERVLAEIGVDPGDVITVYNKIDCLVENSGNGEKRDFSYPPSVIQTSFKHKIGVSEILNEIDIRIRGKYQIRRFSLKVAIQFFEEVENIMKIHDLTPISMNNYRGQAFDSNSDEKAGDGTICSRDEIEFEFYANEQVLNSVKSKLGKFGVEFVLNFS